MEYCEGTVVFHLYVGKGYGANKSVFSVLDMPIMKLLCFSVKVAKVSLSQSGRLVLHALMAHTHGYYESAALGAGQHFWAG